MIVHQLRDKKAYTEPITIKNFVLDMIKLLPFLLYFSLSDKDPSKLLPLVMS